MNKYIKILLATFVIVGFVSCLKDEGYDEHKTGHNLEGVSKIIELGFSNKLSHNQTISLELKDKDTVFSFLPVRLASQDPAPTNIIVTIDTSVTSALIDTFNVHQGTSLEKLPDDLYSFPEGLTVTIPAGSREGYLKIQLNSKNLDPAITYALGFKVAGTTPGGYTLSQNFGTFLTILGAKNKYDGVYTLKGYHNRPTLDFPYNTTVHMVTTGQNSVAFYWPEVNSFGHPIGVGPDNSLSWYGAAISPNVTFDPGTDFVTNVNNIGGATPMSIYEGPGSGQGRFIPDTKDMFVYFRYNANDARAFLDTLTYIGPR